MGCQMLRAGGFWLLCFSFVALPLSANAQENPPTTLNLHTEYLPYRHEVEKGIEYRLMREMPRQAMLIAARDELGIATRDGTLGEIATKESEEPALDAVLAERVALNKTWLVRLYSYDADGRQSDPRDLWPSAPAWEKTFRWGNKGSTVYGEMNPVFEKASREEFVEALQQLGLTKQPAPEGPAPEYDQAAMQATLLKADFIAMFGVLRATHEQIRYKGQTPELLGILARGYANLSMLTQHTWNASSEAFAARAMLYAQRLVVADNESPFSLWNRAYVWAVIGCHQHSLADLEKLADAEPPAWGKLISPFVHFDREALKGIADQDEAIAPWALRLNFQLASAYRYPQWLYDAAIALGRKSPTDYGIYAELAHHSNVLGMKRTGAHYGPAAFSRFSTASLDAVPGMPEKVRALLPTDAVKIALVRPLVSDPNPQDAFSPIPPFVAGKLRALPTEEGGVGLSWAALAYLLEEEMFVQVVNFMEVSMDATESSFDEAVDSVMPFIKGHRYAKYIQAFKINRRTQSDRFAEMTKDIDIVDSRGNMSRLENALWYVKNDQGQGIGRLASNSSQRNYTLQGTIEDTFPYGPDWNNDDLEYGKMLAREFRRIVPHSEVALRMEIISSPQATAKDLAKWESELKSDPTAYSRLAQRYEELADEESAIRCYKKSLEVLPTTAATFSLANLYLKRKAYDDWEKTLVAFLETEDMGLAHAQIHNELAWGFVHRGEMKKAKHHAELAGQTWSAWGLNTASYVTESLADWKASEEWIREMSTNYPSGSGYYWYLWCRRTGRGDVDSAKRLAQAYYDNPNQASTRETEAARGVFFLLESDYPRALECYKKALSFRPSFTCTAMVALLSRELGDSKTADQTLASMLEHYSQLGEERREIDVVGQALIEAFQKESISAEELAALEEKLAAIPETVNRSGFACCLAMHLDQKKQPKEAEEYYRKAMHVPAPDLFYSTLAGARLSEKYNTSRKVNEVVDKSNLWPQPGDRQQNAKSE
jgi:tetratricopeptide (TPR) repeat protein